MVMRRVRPERQGRSPARGAASVDEPNRRGWSLLWPLVRPHRRRVTAIALLSFSGATLEAGFLVLMTTTALAISDGLGTIGPYAGQTLTVGSALALTTLLLALRLALAVVTVRLSTNLAVTVLTTARVALGEAYLHANWAVQQSQPAGRLQELMTTFANRSSAAVAQLTSILTSSLSLFAFLAMSAAVDPLATLAVIAALAVLALVLTPLRRLIKERSAVSARVGLEFTTAVSEYGSLGLEMQTFGVKDEFTSRLNELSHRFGRANYRVGVASGVLPQVYISLAYAAFVGGVALLLAVSGSADLAGIGAVVLLMLRSLSYGQALQTDAAGIAASVPYLDRTDLAIREYAAAEATDGPQSPPAVTPLDVRDVGFAYTPGRNVLSDVSFRVEPQEALGIIGPSGSGKSTLVQLLLGLREPVAGTITAGGVDLREVSRATWTKRIAFVPQDALLITGTVAENIRFFRTGIDEAALRRAAAQANLLSDIELLPRGFDTHLGQRGSQLSGGQRQRLSIARALAGTPELIILDEPTSALDGRSEALVRESLINLRGSVTIVIIAHRMSTLEVCDRILVVENGCVTGWGAPDAVRSDNEFFRAAMELSRLP